MYKNVICILIVIVLIANVFGDTIKENGIINNNNNTVGFGTDICISSPVMVRGRIYVNMYNLAINPFEIEIDMLSLAVVHDSTQMRVAVGSSILGFIAGFKAWFYGYKGNSFSGSDWSDIIIGPQILGNFKIQLPIIKDGLHVYVGEATDYYVGYNPFIKVFTESKVGICTFLGPVSLDCSINKPWLKGFLKSDKAYIGTHISWYISRKEFREKKIKEDEKRKELFRNEMDEYKAMKRLPLDSTKTNE
jgi:hypothetical protein